MAGFAGFDSSDYPGDRAIDWLKANTNLRFCGYYLGPAPNHGGKSWMGKRQRLAGAGWGIVPIYVGEQKGGNLSAQKGTTDGNDAAAMASDQGFGPGTFVFLDLEEGPPFDSARQTYVAAWCDALTAQSYAPGVYCSHGFAADMHQLRPQARIWAFKVPSTDAHPIAGAPFPTPDPSGSGFPGAVIWQREQNGLFTVPLTPPVTLKIDLNVATTPDPAAPAPAPAALTA